MTGLSPTGEATAVRVDRYCAWRHHNNEIVGGWHYPCASYSPGSYNER